MKSQVPLTIKDTFDVVYNSKLHFFVKIRLRYLQMRHHWVTQQLAKKYPFWEEEGCGGDEEVKGQRSAPHPVISPVPERQPWPGQRRFRCRWGMTEWRVQAGSLLLSVQFGLFILSSLPPPTTFIRPILTSLHPQLSFLIHWLTTYKTPALSSPSSFSLPFTHTPSFSPFKLNITTGFHSAGQPDLGSSQWECICLHFTLQSHKHTHAAHAWAQDVGRQIHRQHAQLSSRKL